MANVPTNQYWVPGLSSGPKTIVKSNEFTAEAGAVNANFAMGQSTASKTYNFDSTQLQTALKDILGYSVSLGAGQGIHRQLPMQHPELDWMYASGISGLQGIGSIGMWNPGGSLQPSAAWRMYRAQVQFETPPFRMAVDGGPEYQRYLLCDFESTSEFITRNALGDAGSFYWSSNAPEGSRLEVIAGTNSQANTILATKVKKSFTWLQVPDVGLFIGGFQQNSFSPNIENGIGKVNLGPWMGHPPDTLLLTGWHATPRTMPVNPTVINAPSGIPRAWDVTLQMTYFNPQPNGETEVAGHNLVPHPTDGSWYAAYQGNQNRNPDFLRYRRYDFDTLFKMNA